MGDCNCNKQLISRRGFTLGLFSLICVGSVVADDVKGDTRTGVDEALTALQAVLRAEGWGDFDWEISIKNEMGTFAVLDSDGGRHI